jgi:hypothetical protein
MELALKRRSDSLLVYASSRRLGKANESGDMTRVSRLILASVGVLAGSVALGAAADALPEFLPVTGNRMMTAKGGGVRMEMKSSDIFECGSSMSVTELETDTLGTFHMSLETCSSHFGKAMSCHSPGDEKGEVLIFGTLHYVFDTLGGGGTLGVAALYLASTTSFECEGFSVNMVGSLLCLITLPLASSLSHEVGCRLGANRGEPAETTYWNDSGTIVHAQFLMGFGSSLEEGAIAVSEVVTSKEAGSWMNE